ncbi:spore coat protein CotJB [Caldisalinibacter kiritimatiensis]|uniref:Protein CotJB domain-containing protein n=1 Tax=Caldisalinibacter kiritimatiensis TaxID=1304284 RepID=R1ASM4_9FIRM|nr:spore coat protein CotJB [Caldisalinibacter kiritimatiensis]EOC99671.1 hypothetical protein L21TH_2314 [Caldisalinibacter kiritimatiensis]
MKKNQLELLKELMEVSFCLVESNLYLDTHPTDDRAIRLHNSYSKRYKELVDAYQKQFGPLMYTQMSRCPWQYIESPWPWNIDYSRL